MTSAIAHGRPGRPSDGRLGAVAGITPIAMFGAWTAISGWGGVTGAFVLAATQIALGAVVAGWIVGARICHSFLGYVVGLLAYGLVGYLVLLPLGVVGSTLGDVQSGRVSDPSVAAAGYLLYGAVSAIYAIVFLLPFGAGWIVTFVILRRVFER